MKKIILGLAITLLVAGCSNIESSDKNTFENKSVKLSTVKNSDVVDTNSSDSQYVELKTEGNYVMNKKENKILVVNTKKQDFSSTGGVKEYYSATWLSDVLSDIKIGQQVEFEIDGMTLESYPGKAKTKEVYAIPTSKPKDSKLSVEEALNRALSSSEVDREEVMVIMSIKYFSKLKIWQIDLKQTMQGREFKIKIDDN